jgi:hypothetical protein
MPSANAPYYFLPSRQADLLSVRIPAGLEGKPAGVQAPVQALRMLGVRRLVAEGGMRDPWLQGPAQENWRVTVYRLAAPMPRAWLPRKLALCAEGQQALGGVADAGFLPEETAYVEGLPLAQARELRDGRGLVRLTQDRGSGLTFEVQTPAPNFLVVNQAYNPHWRATANGQAAELDRANYLQCAVPVPAGKSTVRLEYVPDDLYLGAQIAAVAAALALLWLLLATGGSWLASRRARGRG